MNDGFSMTCFASQSRRTPGGSPSRTCPACEAPPESEWLAYAAGLIDGEGFIGLTRGKRPDGKARFSLSVQIEMAVKFIPVLNRMHRTFGGSMNVVQSRKKSLKHATTAKWNLHGGAAACALRVLLPYLTVKREQATIAVDLYQRDDPLMKNGDRAWTDERWAAWDEADRRIKEANRRGATPWTQDQIAQRVGDRWMVKKVDLFGERWETFSGPWPKQGSMRNGCVYERRTWVPPTDETGGSAWPTARVSAERSSRRAMVENRQWSAPSLEQVAELARGELPREFVNADEIPGEWGERFRSHWPTAMASDAKGVFISPEARAAGWATPLANCTTGAGTQGRAGGENLQTQVASHPGPPAPPTTRDGDGCSQSPPGSRRRLNPIFVAALMGFDGWWLTTEPTRSGRSGTPSFHSRQSGRSQSSSAATESWPTPAACVANDGEDPASWRAPAAKLKEKHGNGNGAGVPLAVRAVEVNDEL